MRWSAKWWAYLFMGIRVGRLGVSKPRLTYRRLRATALAVHTSVINNQMASPLPLAGYAFFTVLHRYCQNGSGPNYPMAMTTLFARWNWRANGETPSGASSSILLLP
ncbi:MAG: hypothetical protein ACLRP3_10355 [Escherichia sp.]